MAKDITQHQIRKQLLQRGYVPVPLIGKRALVKGWTRAEIDEAWLKKHVGRSRRFTNTGMRGDDLAPFDLDIDDEALCERVEEAIERVCGPTPYCRFGRQGSPRRLLLYRCPGIERSARTARHGDHMVELLGGSGRQFVAFGPYPGEDYNYAWDDVSPLDVGDPPTITPEQADAALAAAQDILDASQYARTVPGFTSGGVTETEAVLTPDFELLMVETGEVTTWGRIEPDVGVEGCWANVRRENSEFGDSNGVHLLRGPSGEAFAYDFPRDVRLVQPTGLPQLAQALPGSAPVQQPLFGDASLADMVECCVYVASEDAVGRIDAPQRLVKLAHWKTSVRPLTVQQQRGGKTKTLRCSDVWLDHPKRLTADIQAMRPDFPDEALPTVRGERVFNTYRRPLQEAEGGEIETVVAFLDHLFPRRPERELFLDWHALKVANPSWRMHALLMVTEAFGTGRGTWCEDILPKLLGGYCKDVPLAQLVGKTYQSQYNDYLSGSLVVTVREALELDERSTFYRARRAAYEHLKQVVDPAGGREQHIIRKGTANTSETLFASVLISTNHTDALAIPPADRRVIVLENAAEPLPAALAARIHAWHQVPANVAALYHWLMLRAENVQTYTDPFGTPPSTPARERMITAGETDADRIWEAVATSAPGAVITWTQFHAMAHRVVHQSGGELEMPEPARLRAMLFAKPKAYNGRQIRLGGRDGAVVRAYVLRDRCTWRDADLADVKAELQKNGNPGSSVVRLPTS